MNRRKLAGVLLLILKYINIIYIYIYMYEAI